MIDYDCESKDKKEKINLYKLKSKLIQKKFYASLKNENDIIKDLECSIKKLKEIDLIFTRADFELKKYKSTSYPAFLWQHEIVYKYNFFSIIIGIIDGNIDEAKRNVEMYNHFSRKNEQKLEESKIHMLEAKRSAILCDLKSLLTINEPKILFDTLCTYPSYNNFVNCYLDIKDNQYSLDLQVELINSYNKGYKKCNNFYKIKDFDNLIEVYKTGLTSLKECKNDNNALVKKIYLKKRNP